MKKIISLFCTLAMVISMAAVAHADENNYVEWKVIEKDADTAVLELHLVTDMEVAAFATYWDVSELVSKGATITAEKIGGAMAGYNAAQKMVTASYTSAAATITGDTAIAKVTVDGLAENFDWKLKPSTPPRAVNKVGLLDGTNVTDSFTLPEVTTIKMVEEAKIATEVFEKAAISNPTEAKTVGVKATSPEGLAFTKLTAILNNGTTDASVVVYEGASIDAPTAFGLNIMQVPADVTITVTDVVAE